MIVPGRHILRRLRTGLPAACAALLTPLLTSSSAFAKVAYSPTFVLVEDHREVDRIIGYPGEAFFWGLLADILAKLATK